MVVSRLAKMPQGRPADKPANLPVFDDPSFVFFDGAILDGRNCYMAAHDLGVEYPRVEFEGDDPLAFVIAKNLHRRHLDETQRSMVGGRVAKLRRGSNQHTANAASSITQAQAAKLLNVSQDGIQRARRVLDDGAPELVAAVDSGAVSVSAAAHVAALKKQDTARTETRTGSRTPTGQSLIIEAQAKQRLADEYDAAQDRGEIRGANTGRSASAREVPSAEDAGLTHKQVHEARQIRDAERAAQGDLRGDAPGDGAWGEPAH